MYTKHLHQNIKTWEEGLFIYNMKNFKGVLYKPTVIETNLKYYGFIEKQMKIIKKLT